MRGVLYKEIVLSKTLLWLAAGSSVIMLCGIVVYTATDAPASTTSGLMSLALCFFNFFYINLMNGEVFKRDEARRQWVSFAASTPQRLKGHVLGKYLFLLIPNLIVTAIWLVGAAIIYGITKGELDIIMNVVSFFFVFLFFNAVETPFIIRFGADKGVGIKGAVLGGVIFALIVYGLFGDISFLLTEDVAEGILDFFQGQGFRVLKIIAPFAAALCYFLSCLLSVRLYIKGAESYEQ